jgi:SAM-dependent methyltransferase
MQPTDGYPRIETREEVRELLADKCLDTISFRSGEVIADIGAGNGYLEAMLAMFYEDLTFYIQDIDSSVCNQAAVEDEVEFYEGIAGKPFSSRFFAINGTDKESGLPDIEFDRVLMLWTYQYLKEPRIFITDLRSKLKEGGILYVINPEQDYEYGLELRDKYGWNCSTIERQISDIIDCGFCLIRVARNYEDNQQPYIMVFRKGQSPRS